jgi:hypothetical protein
MLTEITKGQLIAWRLGRLKDEEQAPFRASVAGKAKQCPRRMETARVARGLDGSERNYSRISRIPPYVQS